MYRVIAVYKYNNDTWWLPVTGGRNFTAAYAIMGSGERKKRRRRGCRRRFTAETRMRSLCIPVYRACAARMAKSYQIPCAIIAVATFSNPAMFAPIT